MHCAHAQAPEESKERLLNLLAEGSPFGARILATAERLLPAIASTVEVIKVMSHAASANVGVCYLAVMP